MRVYWAVWVLCFVVGVAISRNAELTGIALSAGAILGVWLQGNKEIADREARLDKMFRDRDKTE